MQNIGALVNSAKLFIKILIGKELSSRVQVRIPSEKHGSLYGGWFISPHGIDSKSIVYSFGIGEDISFDISLIEKYGVTVHGFDPTPKSINWIKKQRLPDAFILHEYGLSDTDGQITLHLPANPDHVSCSIYNEHNGKGIQVPVKKLNSIMLELNHGVIDILKIDIEGSEYGVIDDIISSNVIIKQLLIEFHHRFSNVGIAKTKKAIGKLNRHGFKLFSVSESREELSFIKIDTLRNYQNVCRWDHDTKATI